MKHWVTKDVYVETGESKPSERDAFDAAVRLIEWQGGSDNQHRWCLFCKRLEHEGHLNCRVSDDVARLRQLL